MKSDLKEKYFRANIGSFPDSFDFMGMTFVKKEDLRYGTNPHQVAGFYRPKGVNNLVFGDYKLIKTGKGGFSQTNLEDINYAVKVLKYLSGASAVVMKHLNPSGVSSGKESLKSAYISARDSDPQAAFGGVVVFNMELDEGTAIELMQTVTEVVAAPSYSDGAIEVFNDFRTFKRNKHIRVVELFDIGSLPKFAGDISLVKELKVLSDGSVILSDSYLTKIRGKDDFIVAENEHRTKGYIRVSREPTEEEYRDLLCSWYINLSVRSNGVVIVKNSSTIAVGTGEQDRVGAVEQAIHKAKTKYRGSESLEGSVLSSDGFFPFRDSIDMIAENGIKAIVQPGGSVSDYDVIKACNERGIAMVFTDERCFSHH